MLCICQLNIAGLQEWLLQEFKGTQACENIDTWLYIALVITITKQVSILSKHKASKQTSKLKSHFIHCLKLRTKIHQGTIFFGITFQEPF